jgi:hypothetical protein
VPHETVPVKDDMLSSGRWLAARSECPVEASDQEICDKVLNSCFSSRNSGFCGYVFFLSEVEI